jgi:hypothetical protein
MIIRLRLFSLNISGEFMSFVKTTRNTREGLHVGLSVEYSSSGRNLSHVDDVEA